MFTPHTSIVELWFEQFPHHVLHFPVGVRLQHDTHDCLISNYIDWVVFNSLFLSLMLHLSFFYLDLSRTSALSIVPTIFILNDKAICIYWIMHFMNIYIYIYFLFVLWCKCDLYVIMVVNYQIYIPLWT